MNSSSSIQTANSRAAFEIDPIVQFEQDAEERRVAGPGSATIIGWAVYLWVMLDALLNARGNGSVSMLIAGALIDPDGPAHVTWVALIISALQALSLMIAASFLAASPWGRWLKVALRETWFAQPAPRLLRAAILRHAPPSLSSTDATRLCRDLVLFGLCVALLAPVIGDAFATSQVAGVTVLLLSLILSGGLATLIITIVGKALSDGASVAGLIAGCALPLVAAAYASPVGSVLHVTGLAVNEFTYYQIGILGMAIGIMWLVAIGSVGDIELLVITLGGSSIGILRELPDLTRGAFKPFQFQVRPNGEKVVLLSRPVHDATDFQVHSTYDIHDPTSGRWLLLSLSELERSIGGLSITSCGQMHYLECEVKLQLVTAVPEQFMSRLRSNIVRIPIEDLSNAQSRIFSPDDIIGQMQQQLDSVISSQLDATLHTSPFAKSSLTSLTSILGQFRLDVSRLKQGFDMQVAAFRACAGTGLRLDRADEVRAHLVEAFKDVAPLMGRVREAYENASHLDHSIAVTQSSLQADLVKRVKATMNQMNSGASALATAGEAATIRLLDLVELTVQSADIRLTQEARTLHQEITALYKEADTHWSQASAEMGAIAKEHGDVVRTLLTTIIDSRTPTPSRQQLLGLLTGTTNPANGSFSGPLALATPPIFQRTLVTPQPVSTQNQAPAPTPQPTIPNSQTPPIFQRSTPASPPPSIFQRSSSPAVGPATATPPAQEPFPD